MRYDIIIWDFNGTILDDVNLCHQILNQMLSKHHLPTVTLEEYRNIFGFPVIDYYRKVGFNVDNGEYDKLSVEFMELYQKASLSCPLYTNLVSTLQKIKENNILQVCLSASQIDNLKQQLAHFKIDSYFDFVLGLDNIHAKSKLHLGQNWIQQNHFENKKILCIGDSVHDFEVATTLNADCVLMSYGHFLKHRLEKTNCIVLDDLNALLHYLDIE